MLKNNASDEIHDDKETAGAVNSIDNSGSHMDVHKRVLRLSDVNANLCLCLRILYTLLPEESLRFDKLEYELGSPFLQFQFKILIWLVKNCGLRVLPPPLRPLYISYYGRAVESSRFVTQAIQEDNITQIVILGAGFDTTAYRTRALRISSGDEKFDCINDGLIQQSNKTNHRNRIVRVFEVDLPDVQQCKLSVLRRSLSQERWNYYTEGVHYLECNFGVQSLVDVLLNGGFDPDQPSAFLWEGVTYYLSKEAVDVTLSQIRVLANMGWSAVCSRKGGAATTEVGDSETIASPGDASDVEEDQHGVYLLMDYMDEANTLTPKHGSWLWVLEQELSHALGTPFITGFENVDLLLQDKGFVVRSHKARADSEAMLRKMSDYTSVLFENNSTAGQTEPNLAIVTAIFQPKDNN